MLSPYEPWDRPPRTPRQPLFFRQRQTDELGYTSPGTAGTLPGHCLTTGIPHHHQGALVSHVHVERCVPEGEVQHTLSIGHRAVRLGERIVGGSWKWEDGGAEDRGRERIPGGSRLQSILPHWLWKGERKGPRMGSRGSQPATRPPHSSLLVNLKPPPPPPDDKPVAA